MAPVAVFDTPELLCMIFVSLLSEDVDDNAQLPIHSPLKAPVILTQVCRNWRLAALSYPALWSRLLLPLKASMFATDGGLAHSCAVLTEWLQRSRQLPFTLKITHAQDMNPEPYPCCHSAEADPILVRILVQNSCRWSELHIQLDYHQYTLFLQSLPTLDLPELRIITTCDSSEYLGVSLRMQHAPKLENLTLSGGDPESDRFVADRDMPPNLRFFKLRNMTLKFESNPVLPNIASIQFIDVVICKHDFAKFPYFFPQLEDLEIFFFYLEDDLEELDDFVILPNLRSLTANCAYPFPVQSITAPNLRRLEIENEEWCVDDCTTFSDVHSFIKRSSPPLEICHIGGLAVKGGALAPFLDLVPDLKEIEIIDAPTTIHMLKALALTIPKGPSGAPSLRCPKLCSLQCNLVLIDDESPEDLKFMEIEVLTILLINRLKGKAFRIFNYPWSADKSGLVWDRVNSRIGRCSGA